MQRLWLLVEHLVHQGIQSLRLEGVCQAGHVVDDHSQGPDVGAVVVSLMLEHLRREVERGADALSPGISEVREDSRLT